MEIDEFRKKIREISKSSSVAQKLHFTWVCAVRVLPFLGYIDGFDYWKDERQTHLQSIFYALDLCGHRLHRNLNGEYTFGDYVRNGNGALAATARAAEVARTNDAVQAAFVAEAANAAASVAYYAEAGAVERAAIAVYLAAQSTNDKELEIHFQEMLFSDFETITKGKSPFLNNSININKKMWKNFLNNLNNFGCGYFAKEYYELFTHKSIFDFEDIERRVSVPAEVREQGAAAVSKYFKAIEKQGAKHLNEARIVIIGEKGAGKTSLARKLLYIYADMPKDYDSTEGVDIDIWKLTSEDNHIGVNVHIWDFAGHVVTHAAHRFFLSERCVYIIVYDGRTESRNRTEYWLDHAKNYGGNSPIYLVVNEKDPNPIKIREHYLKEKYPMIEGVFHLNIALDFDKLLDFKNHLSKFVLNSPSWNQTIPAKWFAMKEELYRRFKNGADHLTMEEFCEIIRDLNIDDDFDMRRALHQLGICLWYENISHLNTFVINPSWITYGVYKIISWLRKNEFHELWLRDFKNIFTSKEDRYRYPYEKYEFLFSIMRAYELAYPIKYSEDKGLIIPILLEEDQPERNMDKDFPVTTSLLMRYKVESDFPPDTISRFIVRHYQNIMENIVWRYGAKLHDGEGTRALVIENDREIRIYVKGSKATKFLGALRNTFNDIFIGYKTNNPNLEYKIALTAEQVPIYADDGTIMGYVIDGRPFYVATIKKEVNMTVINQEYNVSGGILQTGSNNIVAMNGIINSNISFIPPENLTTEIFNELLSEFAKFLQSTRADDELKGKDRKTLQEALDKANNEADYKKGWRILREAVSIGGDVAGIISGVLAVNPAIPSMIITALTSM